MGCIYVVRNRSNGKYYVGKTIGTMKKRRLAHEASAKINHPKMAFHRALKKYGTESFSWCIIDEEDDEEMLYYLERYAIVFLDSRVPEGYNMTQRGDGTSGFVRSVQDRQRKSEATKRQWQSEKHRKKMSEKRKQWWKDPENAEKIKKIRDASSKAARSRVPRMKGKRHSEETKVKMRLARSKYKHVHDCSGRFIGTIVRLEEKK